MLSLCNSCKHCDRVARIEQCSCKIRWVHSQHLHSKQCQFACSAHRVVVVKPHRVFLMNSFSRPSSNSSYISLTISLSWAVPPLAALLPSGRASTVLEHVLNVSSLLQALICVEFSSLPSRIKPRSAAANPRAKRFPTSLLPSLLPCEFE